MSQSTPANRRLEFDGHVLVFKSCLKSNSFSYRCKNSHICNCLFLLTVPVTFENYNLERWDKITAEIDEKQFYLNKFNENPVDCVEHQEDNIVVRKVVKKKTQTQMIIEKYLTDEDLLK